MTRLLLADVLPLQDPAFFAELYGNASCERRKIADSFRFMKDRMLSIGAAALLDTGLRAFGLRERDMSYGRAEYGKPFFLNAPDIHFNISHSSTKVAVALSDSEIGCDIEEVGSFDPDVAKMSLSREEYEAVMAGESPDARCAAFFRYWTLKESYMKATGRGLSLPPGSFSILGVEGFVFMTPHSFEGYECALCYKPGSGTPEVTEIKLL